ncbi:MAG: histidine kinase [Hyphomicrobiales bacterium]|nr:MAG: histidine kinase [Hyphomicrobiales bacterium]
MGGPLESELAFRAQLVIPEQLQLYDYWRRQADGKSMPSRNEIHPSGFKRLLPTISLIDVEHDPKRYRVRLAGTGLRDVYQREMTGTYLDEVQWGFNRDYWLAACYRIVDRKRPAQGIVRAPARGKEHLVQFWLRLPLSNGGKRVDMILCYDSFISTEKAIVLSELVQA